MSSPKDRVVGILPNGRTSSLINGGDPNHTGMILQAHNPRKNCCFLLIFVLVQNTFPRKRHWLQTGAYFKKAENWYEFTKQKNTMHRIYRIPLHQFARNQLGGWFSGRKICVKNGSCPEGSGVTMIQKSLKPPRFQEQFTLLNLNRRKPQRMAFFDARKMPANWMQDCLPLVFWPWLKLQRKVPGKPDQQNKYPNTQKSLKFHFPPFSHPKWFMSYLCILRYSKPSTQGSRSSHNITPYQDGPLRSVINGDITTINSITHG